MNLSLEKDSQNSCLLDTDSLRGSRALLIGAGGLGCNIAVHLAGAGVGKISVCDFDSVSQSNLNRQFLYTEADIGRFKADAAAAALAKYAADCSVTSVNIKITAENAAQAVSGFDLVALACDNIQTRLAVNRACTENKTTLLDSGIAGACGRVYLYIPGKTACLNCIMEGEKESADKRTVSAAAGAVGSFAAMTALLFLSGAKSQAGKLILIDTVNYTTDVLSVKKSNECKICGGDINA